MRPILVVIALMVSDQAEEMPLAEYDDMVECLSVEGSDEPLGVPVLPRSRCDAKLLDPEIPHLRVEGIKVRERSEPAKRRGGAVAQRAAGGQGLAKAPLS